MAVRARKPNPAGPHICASCFFEAKGAGALAAHQKGMRCKADTSKRMHLAAGLAPMNLRHKGMLQSAGISVVTDYVKYTEGSYENGDKIPPKAEMGVWIPSPIAHAIKRLNFWEATVQVSPPLGFTERIKMVAALAADDELRAAWLVLEGILRQQHLPLMTASQGGLTDAEEARKAQVQVEVGVAIRDLFARWAK